MTYRDMMAELLEIERQILEAAKEPAHKRLLRRIVAQHYDDVCLRHAAFFPHLHSLADRGYLTAIDEGTKQYQLTAKGREVLPDG